jgi:hypothetical protein
MATESFDAADKAAEDSTDRKLQAQFREAQSRKQVEAEKEQIENIVAQAVENTFQRKIKLFADVVETVVTTVVTRVYKQNNAGMIKMVSDALEEKKIQQLLSLSKESLNKRVKRMKQDQLFNIIPTEDLKEICMLSSNKKRKDAAKKYILLNRNVVKTPDCSANNTKAKDENGHRTIAKRSRNRIGDGELQTSPKRTRSSGDGGG